ncbi:glycosyltransferase family A protein [Snuella lapsa]
MSYRITVVIPCYNDGAYIEDAINSILGQTLNDYQIIIVDDGSDKSTKDILKRLDHEKIKVYYEANKGVSSARNFGIALSESEYILTLDADDYFEPTFLEKALDILETHSDVAVVGCYHYLVSDRKIKHVVRPKGGTITNFLTKNEGLGNALFRRSCWEQVGGYDAHMTTGYEDWEFWIAILAKGWRMEIIKEPLFYYRIKENSRNMKATNFHDLELKSYIFNKHFNIYSAHFKRVTLRLLKNNDRLYKRNIVLTQSIEYRLGRFLLTPFKKIKKLISIK